MGCHIGRVIIENNAGTIIFGNVATLNIKITSTSTNGTSSSSSDTRTSSENAETAQDANKASDPGTVSAKNAKKYQRKKK
ncbi:hypothetical protein [Paenibacillus sp. Soil522]|uniref:hypothetical protein n=1 Tax=Paenibacillus sp. Soil522 TaxID=1736388 RepID=UPI0006F30927|nr:hypothetical protein [Paenibacillus sp. Soil522]KRE47107.1 hypothetical protein ASG81_09560 [Paenibacillus sp. Soil522]